MCSLCSNNCSIGLFCLVRSWGWPCSISKLYLNLCFLVKQNHCAFQDDLVILSRSSCLGHFVQVFLKCLILKFLILYLSLLRRETKAICFHLQMLNYFKIMTQNFFIGLQDFITFLALFLFVLQILKCINFKDIINSSIIMVVHPYHGM